MTEDKDYRLHAFVSGRVQGVGFRYFVLREAQDLHLTGWVRNLHDGRVEVVAEGTHPALNQLLIKLRQGPVSADVRDVDYEFSDARGDFSGFSPRQTA